MNLKEQVLLYSTNIYKYYFGSFIIKKLYNSPFRDEKNPSFNIFYGKRGVLLFKDFGYSSGNAIDFVMLKYRLTFKEALDKIVEDLNLPFKGINTRRNYTEVKIDITKNRKRPVLQPIVRQFNHMPIYTEFDLKYWLRDLKIRDKRYLIKHNIYSAKELLINNFRVWNAEESPIYIYPEKYNNLWYNKAYRPLSNDKWRSDYPDAIRMLHNVKNLNYKSKELIITKSNKDCVILDSLGFNICNTQGEDMPIPKDIVSFFKMHFKDIFILYDCDYNKEENTGYNLALKLATETGFKPIFIPEEYECTDTGELIHKFQRETIINLINKWKNSKVLNIR